MGLVLALLLGGGFFLLQGPFFTLQKVKVELIVLDEKSFSPYFPLIESLQEVAQEIEQWKGKKLWQLPFFRLPESLSPSKRTWLEYAKVYRQWPSSLKVELKPKRVRALYLLKKNSGKFLFADGSLSETFGTKTLSKNKKKFKLFEGEPLGLPKAQVLRQKALKLVEVLETVEALETFHSPQPPASLESPISLADSASLESLTPPTPSTPLKPLDSTQPLKSPPSSPSVESSKSLKSLAFLESSKASERPSRRTNPQQNSSTSVLGQVNEIHFSELYGFTLRLSLRSKFPRTTKPPKSFQRGQKRFPPQKPQKEEKLIHLGEQDFALKLKQVSKVLKHLKEKKLQWRVIDASISHKVLVSMRKTS